MASERSNLVLKNFAKPEGFVGRLVGEFLAAENFEINLWAAHMLQVQANEQILEIGFGPGIAIQAMSKVAPNVLIRGIDCSELMVAKAKKRNRKAVDSGQVQLWHANVLNLPDFDMSFDKIIAINNVMYWDKPVEALQQLRSILKPGGFISLVIQRGEQDYLEGKRNDEIAWYMHCLHQAGFTGIRHIAAPIRLKRPHLGKYNISAISILGFRPLIVQMP